MDYQEVIERFKMGYLVDSNGYTTQKDFEALRIAISAMQELQEYKQLGTLEEVREAVEKHKWIPCSERLPEMHREDMEAEGEYYMISNPVLATDGNKIYVAEYEEDDGYRCGWHSDIGEDHEGIIAWMPLPAPYRPNKCHGCFGAANNDCERCSG